MKLVSILTAAAMLLCLAACAKNEPLGNITSDTAAATDAASEAGTDYTSEKSPTDVTAEVTAAPPSQESGDGLTPVYDDSAVVEAYLSNDVTELDEKQSAIYEAAVGALSEFYSDSMTDEEAVIAAHDWIVTHITYDENMLLAIPRQSEDTENPYGALIKHQAICMGYTTTFQLFMDMLGINSKVVHGSAEDEEHAWNLVELGGNWYHVDTTWDDFVPDEDGRQPFHMYCLVTDNVMKTNHVWDAENFPKADSLDRVYYKTHGLYAQSSDDAEEMLYKAYFNGEDYAEIMYDRTLDRYVSLEGVSFRFASQYWLNDFDDYIVVIYWMQ